MWKDCLECFQKIKQDAEALFRGRDRHASAVYQRVVHHGCGRFAVNARRTRAAEEKEVIAEYNDGKCKVYGFESQEEEGGEEWKREHKLYGMAMKIYCDFQSGKAYEDDYEWPELS